MSKTPSRYKAFYLPEEMNITWDKFKKIAEREFPEHKQRGKTSKLLQKLITEYVRLHDLGNPQQTLDHVFKNGKPYRAPLQCPCGRLAEYEFFAENVKMKVCKVCLQSLKMRYEDYGYKPLKKGGDKKCQ